MLIREKDLIPGRVIIETKPQSTFEGIRHIDIAAWMVIGVQAHVKRRHKRSSATREGWHVLLLRLGHDNEVLMDIVITPSMSQWKRLF